ncbi:MAG: hypothetical protein JSR46_09450, partial [Verrucomicrobia bacterium]|nr:hypothetical protein [Verrucomicrobiota bacterium]
MVDATSAYSIPEWPPHETPSTPMSSPIFDASRTQELEIKGTKWNAKILGYLDDIDKKLDEVLPNNRVQECIDSFGAKIKGLLSHPSAKQFNAWIDENNHSSWYKQLGIFLLKLPLKAVRNILRLAYFALKATVYLFVHPLKAIPFAGKLIIELIDLFCKPETYTKVGAGMLGASLAHLMISGGFGLHSYIGLGIGGGFFLFGLSASALRDFAKAEKGHGLTAVKNTLINQLKEVPELMLTGFLIGLLF